MKLLKTISCLFLALALLCPLLPQAHGEESNVYEDAYFAENDWDSLLEVLFQRYEVDPYRVAVGYYNTVTGEEHFHQPDKYMIGASIYKVPLNMAYAEKIAQGEMDWDTPLPDYPYEYMMQQSLIYSNNELSGALMFQLGGTYVGFLNTIAPYLGVDVENVDPQYYNERYTARQYVSCLKTLCTEPERFPRIIETMQQAEPNNYFKLREQRFDIAHKYGYWIENGVLNLNDVGIAYTDDPIVLVVMTSGVPYALDFMAEYCTLMCEYTQYHTARRLAADAAALAEAKAQVESRPVFPSPSLTPVAEVPAEPEESRSESIFSPLLVFAGIVIVSFLAIAGLLLFSRRHRIRLVWGCTAVVLCALACSLCLFASTAGSLLTKPEGDPQAAVSSFFDALERGDYDSAYTQLSGYSSLGLEKQPQDELSRAVWKALQESYEYQLTGPCLVDRLEASQQVQFTYLDLPALEAEARGLVMEELDKLVQSRPRSEIYDENNKYLPAVTQEAYALAVERVLQAAEKHYVTRSLQLHLEYREGRWLVLPGDALLRALSGNS